MALEIWSPRKDATHSISNTAFGYVTDLTYTWVRRSFAGTINLGADGTDTEMYADDIMVADIGTNNPMFVRNDTRMNYTYLPFYVKNTYTVEVFNLGTRIYNNPHDIFAQPGQFFAEGPDAQKQSANGSDSAHNFGFMDTPNQNGLFIIGAMDSTNWDAGGQIDIENLVSTLWTNAAIEGTLRNLAGRAYLSPAQFVEARSWWGGASTGGFYSEGGFTINYDIKDWDSGGRTTFYDLGTTGNILDGVQRIPAGGVIWGYLFFNTTDSNTTTSRITSDGADIGIQNQGNWMIPDIQATDKTDVFDFSLDPPWDPSAADELVRLFRYGLHFVGRKVG